MPLSDSFGTATLPRMGHKQLLLLVLSVVLVGLSVAGGIEIVQHHADRAAKDAEQGVDVSGSIGRAQP